MPVRYHEFLTAALVLLLGSSPGGAAEVPAAQAAALPLLTPGPTFTLAFPKTLSFSADGSLLACNDAWNQHVCVMDIARGEVIWDWQRPSLLATSLGDLLSPGAPGYASDALGWHGGGPMAFAPRGEPQLVIAHRPEGGPLFPIISHGGRVEIRAEQYMLGGYLHYFAGGDLPWIATAELEAPRRLGRRHGPRVSLLVELPYVTALAYAPDGGALAVLTSQGEMRLLQGAGVGQGPAVAVCDDYQRQVERERSGHPVSRGPDRTVPPRDYGTALAFSRDGTLIATIDTAGVICLWERDSLQLITELRGHTKPGVGLEFSPDGTRLVSSAEDGTLCVWDVARQQAVGRRTWTPGCAPLFTFGGGHWLYVAGYLTGTVAERRAAVGLLDLEANSLEILEELTGRFLRGLALSEDGRRLAVTDREHQEVLTWAVAPPDDGEARGEGE